MADEPPETPYMQHLMRALRKRAEEKRTEDATIASLEWMLIPDAFKRAGPILYGADYVGPRSRRDQIAMKAGERHPDFPEASHRESKRAEQYEDFDAWLRTLGLIEMVHHRLLIRAADFRAALAEYASTVAMPWPEPAGAVATPAPAAPSEPTSFKPLRRRPGPKGPTDRDTEIRKLLDDGKRPGVNTPWKTFCEAVRDACQNSRLGDGRAVPGYGDKAIQREVRSIQDEIGQI